MTNTMLQIGETIISLDVIEKYFVCNLDKCKGNCCIYGDSGAPLEKNEAKQIKKKINIIKKYLTEKGKEVIKNMGVSMIDSDGDLVTPLIDNAACAYVYFDNGIAKCAIEKAFLEKKIDFRKPVSCHLYPIRIKKYSTFDAVNYDQWDICKSARKLGAEKQVNVFRFLKEPLIRKYGEEWFSELEIASQNIDNINDEDTIRNKS